ncbi:GNAT family N-acetyltransferase [Methylocystis sp. IM4]|uniref:GNAT family N-acetyltransferase n=1 Tax=Methylocystis sp. IM4 TaxID=3136560 RepID=UPI00311A28C8
MPGASWGRNQENRMDRESAVRHNPQKSRFELLVDGELAIADYVLRDGVMDFTHTETPPALQGRGIASQLVGARCARRRSRGSR